MGQISFFNFGFVRGATKFVEGLQFVVSFFGVKQICIWA